MNNKAEPKGSILQFVKSRYEGKIVQDSLSPAGNWLSYTLEKIEKGMAEITLEVKREMTNPYGNIHGGMMALVMDEVIGLSVISLDTENHYTSLNLNVDFLYAIKEGDRLRARSEVIRAGKKIIHVECSVFDLKDVLLGKASSNLIVTSMKPKDNSSKVAN